MTDEQDIMNGTERLAKMLVRRAQEVGMMVTCAESCTGGMVSAALTDIAGASAMFERSFVTYSNDAKMELLGVQSATLETHGAVSAETAIEMAAGALANVTQASLAVAITGIAGPGGGSVEKPVGLVYFGRAITGADSHSWRHVFEGDRKAIRQQATARALALMLDALPDDGFAR